MFTCYLTDIISKAQVILLAGLYLSRAKNADTQSMKQEIRLNLSLCHRDKFRHGWRYLKQAEDELMRLDLPEVIRLIFRKV